MDHRVAWLALALALALPLPARAEVRPLTGGAIHTALLGQPTDLDPLSPNLADQELAALVFDTLFRWDGGGARPHLVAELQTTHPTRPRLVLRPELRFHDGRSLRAADVVASLERARAAPGGWTLAPIRAARVISDTVVELELSRPAPDLPLLLSTPAASVLPSGVFLPARVVGSGPFLVQQRGADSVRLLAASAPPSGRAFLDSLAFRVFAARGEEAQSFEVGGVQVSHALPVSFLPNPPRRAAQTVDGAMTLLGVLCIGAKIDAALAEALPRALERGLDRERVRRQLRERARSTTALVPPELGGPDAKPVFDPASASTILAPFAHARVTVLTDRSRLDERPVADRLLYELDRLGLDVALEAVDAVTFEARRARGDYQLLLTTVAPPAPDGGLAELAALALVDAAAARRELARAPASVGSVRSARLVPLYFRAVRLVAAPELRNLGVDALGRPTWADAWWWKRPGKEAR